MSHAQFFHDIHPKGDIQASNSNNSSSPLKINKNSHFIKKSSSNSLSSSSSSSSLLNGVATTNPQQPRHPVIIYTHSPKVIHTHPRDFMALVQKLTGFSPEDHDHDHSPPPRPLPLPQHPKSEPINEDQEDLVFGPECSLGNILEPNKDISYLNNTNNIINTKCRELLANDDNESTSVITDENNGSCSLGSDAQVNSSNSCFVPPTPIFDLGNINDNKDINSDISNYNNNNFSDPSIFLDSNAPFPSPNSADLFFSDQPFCNYNDSLFFPSMRSSISSSSSESIKELPDF